MTNTTNTTSKAKIIRYINFNNICWLGFFFCILLLIIANYIEHYLMIEPCSLCLLQRIIFIIISFLFFVSALVSAKRTIKLHYYCHSILLIMLATVGLILAGRQVWLQHLPVDKMPMCSAGLTKLLEYYSLPQALLKVFEGTSECSEVQMHILGFSIASWSLAAFGLLFSLGIYKLTNKKLINN